MMKELSRFILVLAIVMMGFTVAFHALFSGDGAISGYQTYSETLLTLFGSMLGGFDFDAFANVQYGQVGILLMCLYLTVMMVMLLNLLIAVLSTAYAAVTDNVEKEFHVSKALSVTESIKSAEMDLLPSPLNVVQVCLVDAGRMLSLFGWVPNAKRILGELAFSLLMGPVGVLGSVMLWLCSCPTAGIRRAAKRS
ncbi:unnamed protein product, partial [Phaeothamnion confervicola]